MTQENTVSSSPSFRSVIGLSALIFFIADVQSGVGPFLSIYLQAVLHWDAGQIGIALATISVVAIFSQVPSGYIVDIIRSKRLLILLACTFIILGCLLLRTFETVLPIIMAQAFIGLASTLIPPSIAAITMGLFKRARFAQRTSINEFFNHLGNLCTALAMGFVAQWLGHPWILYIVILFSLASILSLVFINPHEIDYQAARELAASPQLQNQPIAIGELLRNKTLLIFITSVILFHFSNAAQLPLVGQILAIKNPQHDSMFMAMSIIFAQIVMAIIAFSLNFIINRVGRKPIFIVAFLILPLRAMLYTLTTDSYHLLEIQLLDGIGAGIFGVLAVVTISDIAKGTGRFNLSQGLLALAISIGAGMSNIIGGYTAKTLGFNGGFSLLAIIGVIGLLFYAILMPETKNDKKIAI